MLDSISLQLMSVGSAEDFVACEVRGNDLSDDIFVGESDDEAVFLRGVFVLGLSDETLASVVVGLA